MGIAPKEKKVTSVANILSAAKRLSAEDKQLLRLRLFGEEDLQVLKNFESGLNKTKKSSKKIDEEIVKLTTSIRQKHKASAGKVLH